MYGRVDVITTSGVCIIKVTILTNTCYAVLQATWFFFYSPTT